jgi:Protein of unknown function (DUF3800)
MYLLYADESCSNGDFGPRIFVLAGVSLFERQGFWISRELDKIAARFNPADPGAVELHASPMFTGRGPWRKTDRDARLGAIKDALRVFANSHACNKIFGVVLREDYVHPMSPMELGFELLASRFEYALRRRHRRGDTQRGVMVFDQCTYAHKLQCLAADFRTKGYSWDVLRNLAEVPFFMDSKSSRLLQLADLVTYAIFRKFAFGDDELFNIIAHKIDRCKVSPNGLYDGLSYDMRPDRPRKQGGNAAASVA